jgi:nitrate reductase assembly molybdenum cofactor insertion protein NarJ
MLHFIHNLISKKYGEYNHDIAKQLLNNQLEQRVRELSNYIIAILSFSEKLADQTNLPRY